MLKPVIKAKYTLIALALLIISDICGHALEKSENEYPQPKLLQRRTKREPKPLPDEEMVYAASVETSKEVRSIERTWHLFWPRPKPYTPPSKDCRAPGWGCTNSKQCCGNLICRYRRVNGFSSGSTACGY